MSKVTFNVPDENSCKDCPHPEDFYVSEIEYTTIQDPYPRYNRIIMANCHLFNQSLHGVNINEMSKCEKCIGGAMNND